MQNEKTTHPSYKPMTREELEARERKLTGFSSKEWGQIDAAFQTAKKEANKSSAC